MNRRRLLTFVLAALCASTLLTSDADAQRRRRRRQTRPRRPVATTPSAPSPSAWPNLDVLSPFKGLKTNSCGLNGAGKAGSEKAKSNRLKNRYHLPDTPFEVVTFDDLMRLDQGRVSRSHTILDFPMSDHPDNRRAVQFTGFVISAKASGCAIRKDPQTGKVTSQGESCNCNTADKTLCDAHIEVVMDPGADHRKGRGVVVVEVTERGRRLAALGLLDAHNNIGRDWSSKTLAKKIVNKWVTFSGWLFYDEDHVNQAWVIDPDDTIGRNNNFRATAWEIHPVMGIEVLPGPPSGR
jgi:hypothetical protein